MFIFRGHTPHPQPPGRWATRGADRDVLQIHRAKAEKARERQIKEEMDAKRARTKAARERKQERQAAKRNALMGDVEEESK